MLKAGAQGRHESSTDSEVGNVGRHRGWLAPENSEKRQTHYHEKGDHTKGSGHFGPKKQRDESRRQALAAYLFFCSKRRRERRAYASKVRYGIQKALAYSWMGRKESKRRSTARAGASLKWQDGQAGKGAGQ